MSHSEAVAALLDGYVAGVVADATAPLHDRITVLQSEVQTLTVENGILKARIVELEKPADPEGWVSIYDTTFEKNDGWTARQETQANDNSYNTPKNVTYGQGMTILGKRETLGGKPFTTGDVLGRHVRTPNYFRADVTGTSPTVYGMWPCLLWFRPLTHGDAGEIDAMETWTYDWERTGAMLWATIHNDYGTVDAKARKANAGLPYAALANSDPAAVHTHTVIKTKGRIEILVDGKRVWCWEKGATHSAANRISPTPVWYEAVYEIPDREWYPRFTLQIGGPNSKDPKPEWQESRMVIHRLRIFKEA